VKVKFPIVVRAGSVGVKIYRTESRGYPLFQVADFSEGRRRLRGFADLVDAKAEAGRIANRLAAGDVVAAGLGAKERASLSRALELLKPTRVSLEVAASTFAECFQILGGNRLLEASQYFARRHPISLPKKSVREAVEEMIEAKRQGGLAERSVDDLRSRLGQFAEAFDGPLLAATGDRIQNWLNGKKLSPQSALNFRRVISNFTGFCVRRGYLPKGWDEVDRVERPKVRPSEIAIYRPDEFVRLLASAPVDFLPSLAIAGLAGLRSAEIERLAWEDIDLRSGFITVGAAKSKTASRRIVPICEALANWLAPCAERRGPVWTGDHDGFYDAQQATGKAAGVKWKANALRHSYASYRFAQTMDAGRVAGELGNSAAVVHQHYRQLALPADAAKWFAISPSAAKNVLPLSVASKV